VLELEDEVSRLREELAKVRRQAAEAVADAHRQHRRDLVPLRQAVAVIESRRTKR
jgi:MerR family transcriptional regulator/heat shock protein HspR